jgi:hypothetical protein
LLSSERQDLIAPEQSLGAQRSAVLCIRHRVIRVYSPGHMKYAKHDVALMVWKAKRERLAG